MAHFVKLYTHCQSSIRLNQHVSPSFPLGWGVKHLSPALFLFVMDPLLKQLQSRCNGASVDGMYAGGFLHADDIRTLASNLTTLEDQTSIVVEFTRENFLRECRELEQRYSSNFTMQILLAAETHDGSCILREADSLRRIRIYF